MDDCDAIIIGSGHNGLICACYLAWAGLRVVVVEANREIGGGTTTEEVTLPGYRSNLHSNFHIGVVDSPWFNDLELQRYGHSYIVPPAQHAAAFDDGTAIVLHGDPDRSARSIARFSAIDAEAYRELFQRYAVRLRPTLRSITFSPPLSPDQLGQRLGGSDGEDILRFSGMSMNEAVDSVFEHERTRTIFKLIINSVTVEDTPGTGAFLPTTLSLIGRMALPVGGSIQLPLALTRRLEAYGGRVVTGRAVRQVLVEGSRARGVVLDDDSVLSARKVVTSSIDAPSTIALVGPQHFPHDVVDKIAQWKWGARTLCTLHVALNEPPRYRANAFDPDLDHTFSVYRAPETGAELRRDFGEVDGGEFPSHPIGNSACDSLFDRTYAPAGKHSAFWWVWAPYDLRDGGSAAWDAKRTEATDQLLSAWHSFAPNLTRDNVLGSHLFTPLDIERRIRSMVRGSMRVGAYYKDQTGYWRPHPSMSDGRTAVDGLYTCGSSTGYGGGISGASGYSVAGVIASDLGLSTPWQQIAAPGEVASAASGRN
jgi:phytoene dehydrogenase-like protein